MSKRLITQADVIQAAESGQTSILAPPGQCIVTPGARDKAQSLNITISDSSSDSPGASPGGACPVSGEAPAASGAASPLGDSIIQQVSEILSSRLPAGAAGQDVERIVREVVAAKLDAAPAQEESGGQTSVSASGVCLVKGERLLQQEAGMVPVDEKVLLADAMQCGEGYKMAGGFMQWEKASFRRTVEHSEISVVLDGELHLTVGGKTIIGRRGDMIFFPQGAKVIYSAPGKVRLACVNCIQ